MEQIKQLNLTENDFQLLVDGLDALPEKGAAGSMMVDLLGAAFMKDGEAKDEFERKRLLEAKKREEEKKMMMEDIRILQGKLLLMKRYLQENNLLKQVNEIIQP